MVQFIMKNLNSLLAGGGGGGGGFGMVHSPRTGKYMKMDYLRLLYSLW